VTTTVATKADAKRDEEPQRPLAKRILFAFLPLLVILPLLLFDMPWCASKLAFGVPCPGCGLTRASFALAKLDLAGALTLHPLVLVFTPLVGASLLRSMLLQLGVIKKDFFDPMNLPRHFMTTMFVLLTIIWVIRLATGFHPDPIAPQNGYITGPLGHLMGWW
jgi:hypothetical protein